MIKSKELAKKNWKGSGDSSVDEIWFGIKDKVGPTEFLGYEFDKADPRKAERVSYTLQVEKQIGGSPC